MKKALIIIVSIIAFLTVAYVGFLATLCDAFTYGSCPMGCVEECVPSTCDSNTGNESFPSLCSMDCRGPGSCRAPDMLR
jgi:hypothetical protein